SCTRKTATPSAVASRCRPARVSWTRPTSTRWPRTPSAAPGRSEAMTATVQAQPDERIAKSRLLDRLVIRPEIGALLGAALVFVFFSIFTDQFLSPSGVATWLDDSSTLGIMAVVVALL